MKKVGKQRDPAWIPNFWSPYYQRITKTKKQKLDSIEKKHRKDKNYDAEN